MPEGIILYHYELLSREVYLDITKGGILPSVTTHNPTFKKKFLSQYNDINMVISVNDRQKMKL
jgi:hypothetical protein